MSDNKIHTLAEYINRELSRPPDGAVLALPSKPDGYANFRHYSVTELRHFADKAAEHLIAHGVPVRQQGQPPLTVGIFAAGTISWAASCYAILRMGHTVLVLSSRLTDDAVSTLLEKAHGDAVLFGSRKPELQTTKAVRAIPISTAEQLETELQSTNLQCQNGVINPKQDVATIVHSSGSTSLPKLLPRTHETVTGELTGTLASLWSGEIRVWIASAFYNSFGFLMMLCCLTRQQPLFYDNDLLPFTPDGLIAVMREGRFHFAAVTPHSLGLIVSHPDGLAELQKCQTVRVFGAVLPQEIGDKLVQAGIRLGSGYGTTEIGTFMMSGNRPKDDMQWDYLLPLPAKKQYMEFRPVDTSSPEEKLYELVVLDGCPELDPRAPRSNDPPGSFHTGDLFLKHPTKPDRWKIVGRKDDQLKVYYKDRQTIVDGIIYENLIKEGCQDVLDDVVLFGQGRDKLGLLVFAEKAISGKQKPVLDRVWDAVEQKINGRFKVGIEKEMIVIVGGQPADQALPRTTKLNFNRAQVYMRYKERIDEAYHQLENGSLNGQPR